jgi:hypothetical protein
MRHRRFTLPVACAVTLAMMVWTSAAEAQYITGSGTAGRISKFTGTTTIGNSVLFESGSGYLGLGTTSPRGPLHIYSTRSDPLFLQTTTAGMTLSMKDNATTSTGQAIARIGDNLDFRTMDQFRLVIREDGRVGIGAGAWNPQAWLHVDAGSWGDAALFQSSAAGMTINMKSAGTTSTGQALARVGDSLDLRTMDTPRVTVTSGGYVGIGTTTPTALLHVNGIMKVNGELKLPNLSAKTGTALVGVDISDGSLHIAQGSSLRYKTAVRDLTGDADAVLDLRPVRFQWISNGQPEIGLIAEEVDKALPDLVIYDKEGRPDAVKYDKVPVYLLQVVRAQQSRITALEDRLKTLEETVARLAPQTAQPPLAATTDAGK